VAEVKTLKHIWYCCNACGSASRDDRPDFEHTFAFRTSVKTLTKHKPPMATSIGRNKAIETDVSKLFDYMASDRHVELHKQQYKVVEGFLETVIRRYGIDVKGKSILDVSGGNGSFIKEFEAMGARVALTEFNQKSVEFARERFGVDARRFDFNADHIGELFKDKKFDLVFMRFAVMFCLDMSQFLERLKPLLNPGALIVVNGSTEPSLGTMLRFQYDDYAYLVLYDPGALKDIFSKNGFELTGEHRMAQAHDRYDWDMHPKVSRLDFFLYRIPAFFKWKNRDLNMNKHVFIFSLK
jgi:ubiquinone/menaquinone biosynthesis C-methylase UbiE